MRPILVCFEARRAALPALPLGLSDLELPRAPAAGRTVAPWRAPPGVRLGRAPFRL